MIFASRSLARTLRRCSSLKCHHSVAVRGFAPPEHPRLQGSDDPFKSFLWNMVALEMLQTRDERGEMLDILPRRVGALLDWSPYWKRDNCEERIKNAYKKRNALLHQGRRDEVTDQDLAFTDHILVNVLTNLVSHPKLFSSKDAFVEFSQKVEAQRTLSVKQPRVRPKTLKLIRPTKPRF